MIGHSCMDCSQHGSCNNPKEGKDFVCNQWEWKYSGSWFDK
nr:MAG TPA_asm: protein of unknown function (DUF4306) [Caudoviricetes sp.]